MRKKVYTSTISIERSNVRHLNWNNIKAMIVSTDAKQTATESVLLEQRAIDLQDTGEPRIERTTHSSLWQSAWDERVVLESVPKCVALRASLSEEIGFFRMILTTLGNTLYRLPWRSWLFGLVPTNKEAFLHPRSAQGTSAQASLSVLEHKYQCGSDFVMNVQNNSQSLVSEAQHQLISIKVGVRFPRLCVCVCMYDDICHTLQSIAAVQAVSWQGSCWVAFPAVTVGIRPWCRR